MCTSLQWSWVQLLAEIAIWLFIYFLRDKLGIAVSLKDILTLGVCGKDFPKAFRSLVQQQENTAAKRNPLKYGLVESVRLVGWRGGPKDRARDLAITRPWWQLTACLLSFSCTLWPGERGMAFRYGWKSSASLLVLNCCPMTVESSAVQPSVTEPDSLWNLLRQIATPRCCYL